MPAPISRLAIASSLTMCCVITAALAAPSAAGPGLIATDATPRRGSLKPHLVFLDPTVGPGQRRRAIAADPPLLARPDLEVVRVRALRTAWIAAAGHFRSPIRVGLVDDGRRQQAAA